MEDKKNASLQEIIMHKINLTADAVNKLHLYSSHSIKEFNNCLFTIFNNTQWVLQRIENQHHFQHHLKNALMLLVKDINLTCVKICKQMSRDIKEENYHYVHEHSVSLKNFLNDMIRSLRSYSDKVAMNAHILNLNQLLKELTTLRCPRSNFPHFYSLKYISDEKQRGSTRKQSLSSTMAGIFLTNPFLLRTHPVWFYPPSLAISDGTQRSAKNELIPLLLRFTLTSGAPEQDNEQMLKELLQSDKSLWDRVAMIIHTCENQIKLHLQGELPQQLAFDYLKTTKHIGGLLNYLNRLEVAIKKMSSSFAHDSDEQTHMRMSLDKITKIRALPEKANLYSFYSHPTFYMPPTKIDARLQTQSPREYSLFPSGKSQQEAKENKSMKLKEVEQFSFRTGR